MGKTILRCVKCKKDFQSSNWDERHCPDCRDKPEPVKLPDRPVNKSVEVMIIDDLSEAKKPGNVGVKLCSRGCGRLRATWSFSYCKECHAERTRQKYVPKKAKAVVK